MLRRGLMAVGIWCAAGSIPGAAQTPALDADTEARIEALEPQVIAWRHDRIRTIATRVAESMGATAEVTIGRESSYPVTVNDPELTERMGPVLEAMATNGIATNIPETGAEDFAFFANEVPGFYFILGGRPPRHGPSKPPITTRRTSSSMKAVSSSGGGR